MEFTVFLYDIGVTFHDVPWSIEEEDERMATRRTTWRETLGKAVKPIEVSSGKNKSKGGGRGRKGKWKSRLPVADEEGAGKGASVIKTTPDEEDQTSSVRDWEDEVRSMEMPPHISDAATSDVPDESEPGDGEHFDPDNDPSSEMDQAEVDSTFRRLVFDIEKGTALRIIKWANGLDVPPQDVIDPREYEDENLCRELDAKDPPRYLDEEWIIRRNLNALDCLVAGLVSGALQDGPCVNAEEFEAFSFCCRRLEALEDRVLMVDRMVPGGLREKRKSEVLRDLRSVLVKFGCVDIMQLATSIDLPVQEEDASAQVAESAD